MNYLEKILAKSGNKKKIKAGDFIEAKCDLIVMNDITGPIAIKEFLKRRKKLKNPERIFIFCDHFTPNKDIKSAENVKFLRDFAKKFKVNFYENQGIEHVVLPEEGWVVAGDVVIGADSHTCTYGAVGAFSTGVGSTDVTYAMITGKIWLRVPEIFEIFYYGKRKRFISGKDLILYTIGKIGVNGANYLAMKFSGPAIEDLSMDERFTICNMAVEAGAKTGFIVPDKKTKEFLKTAKRKPFFLKDEGKVQKKIEIDVGQIEPLVAKPFSPENICPVRRLSKIKIDQVVIGSCTNGRISDFRQAAEILKGKKIKNNLRVIILPGSQKVFMQVLKEGLVDIFLKAGCVICPPSCGPCLGGHLGVLAENEVAISTTNRNFFGRMGARSSKIYLSSPYVAASSALTGRITSPEEI